MQQSPSWETDRFSGSQKNSPLFTEPLKFITAFKRCLPSVPILSQINPVHFKNKFLFPDSMPLFTFELSHQF